jgi:acyl-coenzyme A synthetase/AMP-(fatty) acid ligase
LSPVPIANILKAAGAGILLYDPALAILASSVVEHLPGLRLVELLSLDEISQRKTPSTQFPISPLDEADRPYAIFHSSGTTGLPKLIPVFNRAWLTTSSKHLGELDCDVLGCTPFSHLWASYGVYNA